SSQDSDSTTVSCLVDNSLPAYLLVASSCLLDLFTRCLQCGIEPIDRRTLSYRVVGTAIVLKWSCPLCAEDCEWTSQPSIEKYYEGNLKLTAASYTTGLPIPRLLAMGKEMGLALPCERTIRNQLTDVVIPAVDIVYQDHMKTVEATVRGVGGTRGVDLAVDGRYDSPGYTATHCTISIIDLSTSLILRVVNMHKMMPGIEGISGRMEKEGVKRGLKEVIAKQFEIRSMVSDNDARISKMVREEPQFQNIRHLLDFWHIIKGVNHDLKEVPEYSVLEETDNKPRLLCALPLWRKPTKSPQLLEEHSRTRHWTTRTL
ncbi:hypothetical protein PFISCL1PPCAC_3743, partial [Pristionchus fissidentatus]